jgi:hypothetical protein
VNLQSIYKWLSPQARTYTIALDNSPVCVHQTKRRSRPIKNVAIVQINIEPEDAGSTLTAQGNQTIGRAVDTVGQNQQINGHGRRKQTLFGRLVVIVTPGIVRSPFVVERLD